MWGVSGVRGVSSGGVGGICEAVIGTEVEVEMAVYGNSSVDIVKTVHWKLEVWEDHHGGTKWYRVHCVVLSQSRYF